MYECKTLFQFPSFDNYLHTLVDFHIGRATYSVKLKKKGDKLQTDY